MTYDCPKCHCDEDMEGSFGDDVTCPCCGTVWETDWDYTSYDSMACWITKEKDETT